MKNYLYQTSVEYIPFSKRFWDKATFIVVLMGVQAVVFLVIAIALQTWHLVFIAVFLSFGGFINAYIFRQRMRYFLQGIAIDKEHIVNLDLYLKNENLHIRLPLDSFSVKFNRSVGKDSHVKLLFFDGEKRLGFQYDYRHWKLGKHGRAFYFSKTTEK